MWKLVFKNLWANRKKNIWLFIELIAVVIISWRLIDVITVYNYAVSRDTGYDQENMYVMGISTYLTKDMRYDSIQEEDERRIENIQRLRSMVNNLQGVKSSTFALQYQLFESTGNRSSCFIVDSIQFYSEVTLEFVPGTDFFTTLGIPGEKAEKYSTMSIREGDMVLDEKFAEMAFPGENIEGKQVMFYDSTHITLVGAVPHVIPKSAQSEVTVMYESVSIPNLLESFGFGKGAIVVRTRPDISDKEFKRIFAENQKQLHAGNFYVSSLTDFGSRHTAYMYRSGTTNKLRINTALAIFFGISLCLGVIGSFYLQTRRRSEEGGIMRSFGATRGFLVRELLQEGVILTTIAWIIGCIIYLQYAIREGLEMIGWGQLPHELLANWTDHFAQHFIIVSLIVYVVLLIVVTIGIYIPARNISRVNPVDALRNE